jgi:hypothetical protein
MWKICTDKTRTDVDGEAMALRYRQLHALGWWRAMKGNQWPAH